MQPKCALCCSHAVKVCALCCIAVRSAKVYALCVVQLGQPRCVLLQSGQSRCVLYCSQVSQGVCFVCCIAVQLGSQVSGGVCYCNHAVVSVKACAVLLPSCSQWRCVVCCIAVMSPKVCCVILQSCNQWRHVLYCSQVSECMWCALYCSQVSEGVWCVLYCSHAVRSMKVCGVLQSCSQWRHVVCVALQSVKACCVCCIAVMHVVCMFRWWRRTVMASFCSSHRWTSRWQATGTSWSLMRASSSRSSHQTLLCKRPISHGCLSQNSGACAQIQGAVCTWPTGNTASMYCPTHRTPNLKDFWRAWSQLALWSQLLLPSISTRQLFWWATQAHKFTEVHLCKCVRKASLLAETAYTFRSCERVSFHPLDGSCDLWIKCFKKGSNSTFWSPFVQFDLLAVATYGREPIITMQMALSVLIRFVCRHPFCENPVSELLNAAFQWKLWMGWGWWFAGKIRCVCGCT